MIGNFLYRLLAGQVRGRIILRQSPDWARPDKSYQVGTADAFDRLRNRPPGFTRSLISLWNHTFGIGFFETRQFLKDVTLRNFATVRDAELVEVEKIPALGRTPSLILFSDDDDWFNPDIIARLAVSLDREVEGLTWTSVRFDGAFQRRTDDPGFCFTNNYAVTERYVTRDRQWLTRVLQHGDANARFHEPDFAARHMEAPLSIASKHPASTVMLEKALAERPGRDGLIALVEGFNARAEDTSLPADLAWAGQAVDQVSDFFRKVATSRR